MASGRNQELNKIGAIANPIEVKSDTQEPMKKGTMSNFFNKTMKATGKIMSQVATPITKIHRKIEKLENSIEEWDEKTILKEYEEIFELCKDTKDKELGRRFKECIVKVLKKSESKSKKLKHNLLSKSLNNKNNFMSILLSGLSPNVKKKYMDEISQENKFEKKMIILKEGLEKDKELFIAFKKQNKALLTDMIKQLEKIPNARKIVTNLKIIEKMFEKPFKNREKVKENSMEGADKELSKSETIDNKGLQGVSKTKNQEGEIPEVYKDKGFLKWSKIKNGAKMTKEGAQKTGRGAVYTWDFVAPKVSPLLHITGATVDNAILKPAKSLGRIGTQVTKIGTNIGENQIPNQQF